MNNRNILRAAGATALFVFLLASLILLKGGRSAEEQTEESFEIVLQNALGSEDELREAEKQEAFDRLYASYEHPAISRAGGYVNIRRRPDSSDMTNIIGKLGQNAVCDVISEEEGWSLIRTAGLEGYVKSSNLASGEEGRALAYESYIDRVSVLTEVLNVRSTPEVRWDNIIGKARKGEKYVLKELQGDWAMIESEIAGAEEAWVNVADGNAELGPALNEGRRYDLREMVLTQYEQIVVPNINDYVNIRKTPEDQGINNIIGKFTKGCGGELLETVENAGGTWYKIRSGKVTGYVSAAYCRTGYEARDIAVREAYLQAYVRVESLNVRTEPSLDARAWTSVTSGQEYHVLNMLDEWVEIELDSSDENETDRAFISTRDNNVEVRYGLGDASEYYPLIEARNKAAAFRNSVVNYACQFIGNPYVWGGTSLTKGCDCSGFTQSVFKHFGISLPRVSADQAGSGSGIKSDKMKPGDLVFYANSSGRVNHVGIYIGNGQVVNAASRRSGIKILKWNYRTPVAIRNVIGP